MFLPPVIALLFKAGNRAQQDRGNCVRVPGAAGVPWWFSERLIPCPLGGSSQQLLREPLTVGQAAAPACCGMLRPWVVHLRLGRGDDVRGLGSDQGSAGSGAGVRWVSLPSRPGCCLSLDRIAPHVPGASRL